jgi:hypothetical protein
MFQAQLKHYVTSHPKLVTAKPAKDGMYVLKYTKKVFFNNLWNRFLEECRGTIVDSEFNLISYPFTKIYNYGIDENSISLSDDALVRTMEKINGFMVACTWHNGELLVSTTGSTTSPYVTLALETIGNALYRFNSVCEAYPHMTFMFECVHPADPHIIPEIPGMYLLGMRKKEWHSPILIDDVASLAAEFNCFAPAMSTMTLRELKQQATQCRTEGYVFYTNNGDSAKIKSPYYLVNKFIARKTPDRLVSLLTDNSYRNYVDEEFYPLCETLKGNLDMFTSLDEQARLAYIQHQLHSIMA